MKLIERLRSVSARVSVTARRTVHSDAECGMLQTKEVDGDAYGGRVLRTIVCALAKKDELCAAWFKVSRRVRCPVATRAAGPGRFALYIKKKRKNEEARPSVRFMSAAEEEA